MLRLGASLLLIAIGAVLVRAENHPSSSGGACNLDSGQIKIGVSLDRGGRIGFHSDSRKIENVVNVHDLGRWIGQSCYAGPAPFGQPHPGWRDRPWNPVSAGDVYGHSSKVVEKTCDAKSIYFKSIPLQWAVKDIPGNGGTTSLVLAF